MPIEGYYFCSMACVHEYNSWIADMVETKEVMPDDGPGNADPQSFLMPARPRPNALIELSPEELCDEGDQQLEGEESHAHGKQQHTRAHALRTKIPAPPLPSNKPSPLPSHCLPISLPHCLLISLPIAFRLHLGFASLLARPFLVVPAGHGAAGKADHAANHAATDRAVVDRAADADRANTDRAADADRAMVDLGVTRPSGRDDNVDALLRAAAQQSAAAEAEAEAAAVAAGVYAPRSHTAPAAPPHKRLKDADRAADAGNSNLTTSSTDPPPYPLNSPPFPLSPGSVRDPATDADRANTDADRAADADTDGDAPAASLEVRVTQLMPGAVVKRVAKGEQKGELLDRLSELASTNMRACSSDAELSSKREDIENSSIVAVLLDAPLPPPLPVAADVRGVPAAAAAAMCLRVPAVA